MLPFWIIEKLDIIEYAVTDRFAGCTGFSAYPFTLEQLEKAFGYRIIVAVSASAYAGFQIMLSEEGLPLMRGRLAALV